MEGSGKMVVTAVGINSQSGIIFALLGAAVEEAQEIKEEEKKAKKKEKPGKQSSESRIPVHSTNSHVSNAGAAGNRSMVPIPEESEKENEKEKDKEPAEKHEKSVLQAKLTKLAIQIGYGGMLYL